MNILITGAGGFLGKHIIREVLKRTENNILATSLTWEGMEEFDGKITYIPNEDIFDYDFSQVDIVINCAFPRAADGEGYAKGIDFLNGLFSKIQPYNNCGIIDISSQSVYSYRRKKAADEESTIVLESVYDIGKYCMELLIDSRLEEHNRIHLRLASLIGKNFNQRITNRFIKQLIAGEPIIINGGRQLFGFLDVRDCADAICTVIEKWDLVDKSGSIYNIGPEKSYSLVQIANMVIEVGSEHGFNQSTVRIEESDEWINSGLDSHKFCKDFSWKPKFTLKDSITYILMGTDNI